jgi:hypothetical protein
MKTPTLILLALLFLIIGVMIAVGYLMIEGIVPWMKEHLP